MIERLLSVLLAASIVAAIGLVALRYIEPHPAYPVACADIPESDERVVIVRDGKVECHYKINRLKDRK